MSLFVVTSYGDSNKISLLKDPRLIAAKHRTDTVIAEIIEMIVKEKAFFLILNINEEVKITSFTVTFPLLNDLIIFNIRDTELLKRNRLRSQLKIK